MRTLTLLSPAKLNLYLRVISKRPDGYHNLITLFERINLCDELRFRVNRSGKIRIFPQGQYKVPAGPKNLIYKAARLMQNQFALANGVDVWVKKRIPVAAGLGGGSTNAATTLLALNQLWQLALPKRILIELGRQLGSDVPFFLYQCSWALGKGRGDDIKPLPIRTKLHHILLVPRMKVFSSQVFTAHKLQLTKKRDDVNILIRALRRKDISEISALLANDLETTILRCHPRLQKAKTQLQKEPVHGVAFSGSGPSLFGLVPTAVKAKQIISHLKNHYKNVWEVCTL